MERSTSPRPNFLFFFPDQHRPDWAEWNPALPLRTPNLSWLARRGMRFTNAYCNSPLCAPSRASLASGKGYERCGVRNNGQDYPLDQPTYYQSLRQAGYRVAGVGKLDLHKPTLDWGPDGSRLLEEWGFTEGLDNEGKLDGSNAFRANPEAPGPYLSFLRCQGLAERYAQEHRERKQHLDAYATVVPDDAYCDNWLSENGLRFLSGFPAGQPWHLVVNFTGPHNPMDVTPSMRERWQDVDLPLPHDNQMSDQTGLLRNRQNYAAMIENIDRQVGRFIDAVAARGELKSTIVVYASDHGEMLGDHHRWGKSIWYQPSVRVPLIVAGPGIQEGVISDALVSLHDLAATFLECADSRPMPDMDAVSLCPLLQGQTDSHRDRVIVGLTEWRLVFDRRFKLVIDPSKGTLLFDLREDPCEDHNVADLHPEVVDRLRQLLTTDTPLEGR